MFMELIMAIILKVIFVLSFYSAFKFYYEDRIESLTISYVFSYAVYMLILLVLSVFQNVNKIGIIILLLLVSGCVYIYAYWTSKKKICCIKKKVLQKKEMIPLLVIIGIFAFLFIRVFFYYDTTDDALIQGMTKLAFMQQHETLFVHYDSLTVNTFCNEWVGELNGLYYMLMCGRDIAAGFGNVEIYGFIVLAATYCVRIYGYRGKYSLLYVLFVVTLPCITGLAMTIKTDLCAIILLPLAVACLIRYYKEKTPQMLFASIIMLGATAASKISVLPAAGLLLVALVIYYFVKAKEKPVVPVVFGGVTFCVFCSRYILNIIQYKNPFQRALNEKMRFSFQNIITGIKGCISEFNEAPELINTMGKNATNWVVCRGTGYAGHILFFCIILTIIIFVINFYKNRSYYRFLGYTIGLPWLGAICFFFITTIWYDWSFRYIAGYILVLVFAFIGGVCGKLEEKVIIRRILVCLIFTLALFNTGLIFRGGQAHPYKLEDAQSLSKTQKKLSFSSLPKSEDLYMVPGLIDVLENGGSGLIFDTFSYPYYHFFGDDNCVYIDLVYDEQELMECAFEKEYDFYVICTSLSDCANYKDVELFFREFGYDSYETTSGLIFMKNNN